MMYLTNYKKLFFIVFFCCLWTTNGMAEEVTKKYQNGALKSVRNYENGKYK